MLLPKRKRTTCDRQKPNPPPQKKTIVGIAEEKEVVHRSYRGVANHVRVTLGEKQGRQILFFKEVFLNSRKFWIQSIRSDTGCPWITEQSWHNALAWAALRFQESFVSCSLSLLWVLLWYRSLRLFGTIQGCQVHPLLLWQLIHSESQLHVFYARQSVTFI